MDHRLRETFSVFLRLGLVAFGGPAAHIAMMRDELVRRRAWVDDERFLDLVGATNLIPGPNSTELAMHLGWERARGRGLVLAGVAFIVPAAVIVTGLAWLYVRYGTTPAFADLLAGVVPVVMAIIVWAVVPLARVVAGRGSVAVVLGVAGLVAYAAGVNELLILAGGALLAVAAQLGRRVAGSPLLGVPLILGHPRFAEPNAGQLGELFLTLLKIGAVLYGSGYVLLAFLEADLVDRLGWLSHAELLDAISIGQVTPGPVFTTATFVGYLVAGIPGAIVATVAIFAPSFCFVGLLTRLTDRIRASAWASAMLDGVNAVSLALMVGVAGTLGRNALTDVVPVALFVLALVALWRTRWNSAWLILGGAATGILLGLGS